MNSGFMNTSSFHSQHKELVQPYAINSNRAPLFHLSLSAKVPFNLCLSNFKHVVWSKINIKFFFLHCANRTIALLKAMPCFSTGLVSHLTACFASF